MTANDVKSHAVTGFLVPRRPYLDLPVQLPYSISVLLADCLRVVLYSRREGVRGVKLPPGLLARLFPTIRQLHVPRYYYGHYSVGCRDLELAAHRHGYCLASVWTHP